MLAAIASQSPRYIAAYLSRDLSELPTEMQKKRLTQLSSLGRHGLSPLVRRFVTGPQEISTYCGRLVDQCQNAWTTLPAAERRGLQFVLVDTIESSRQDMPAGRRATVSRMLQRLLSDLAGDPAIEISGDDATDSNTSGDPLRQQIAGLIAQLRPDGPAIVSAADPGSAPQRLVRRARVVIGDGEPTGSVQPADSVHIATIAQPTDPAWTQWPPDPAGSSEPKPSSVKRPAILKRLPRRTSVPPDSAVEPSVDAVSSVGTPDRSTPEQRPEVDHRVEPVESSVPVVSPLAALADDSVFRYLHDADRNQRGLAELELRQRGYDDAAMQLARIAGSPEPTDRIELANRLSTLSHLDPRPWLRFLCRDDHREVRLAAMAVVATFDDSAATELLRNRLDRERDPVVSYKLRQILQR